MSQKKRTREEQAMSLLDWFEHYFLDEQYKAVMPEKDFQLKEVLNRIKKLKEG